MLHHKASVEGKEGIGVVCLAAEIEQLHTAPQLELSDGSCVEPTWAALLLGSGCCEKHARCERERGSLCGCQGKTGRQKIPGEDDIPAVGNESDLATRREAELISKAHCTYSTRS
eukprot:2791303-Pleurochrysis_carterae.AAC.4